MVATAQVVEGTEELAPVGSQPTNGASSPVPSRRLKMDDYSIFVNDQEYHPRVGEWLEVAHSRTIREARDLEVALKVREGESPLDYNGRVWAALAGRYLLAWNLRNLTTGEPLPQPTTPEAWMELTEFEFGFITGRVIVGWRDLPPFPTAFEPTPPG